MTLNRPPSWILRSLAIGGIASMLDVTVLLITKQLLGLPTPLCTALGVSLGATANFLLNRRVAFRAESMPMLPAALRFAAGTAVLVAIHAACVGMLVDRLGVPLLIAKYGADAGILLGGNLLLMRYVVFAQPVAARRPQEV